MNYGYKNEYDFVEMFNGKYLKEFDDNSQKFLLDLFDNLIENDEKIKAWKNRTNQKSDIFIRYKNYVKGISLKCGNSNSIHHEPIQEFRRYLEHLGIPYKVIEYYVSYHYGYAKDEKGNTDTSKTLSSDEYKAMYQHQLNIFNKYINKTRIIVDMIDRFIIRGRNSDYDIDAFISGTTNDYVWLLKYDVYDLILSKRCLDFTSPHIACMTIGPKKRNINHDSKNAKDRFLVCIRWNFIKEDIEKFRKDNQFDLPS